MFVFFFVVFWWSPIFFSVYEDEFCQTDKHLQKITRSLVYVLCCSCRQDLTSSPCGQNLSSLGKLTICIFLGVLLAVKGRDFQNSCFAIGFSVFANLWNFNKLSRDHEGKNSSMELAVIWFQLLWFWFALILVALFFLSKFLPWLNIHNLGTHLAHT